MGYNRWFNSSGETYKLDGKVQIGVDVGADGTASDGDSSLTINPGVTFLRWIR